MTEHDEGPGAAEGRPIDFFRHGIGEVERAAVDRVLRGVFLSSGPEVRALEDDARALLGTAHAVGVSSCTAGLQLSLMALDIGPGDEVITTPMSYIATANAVLYTGATPRFVDVEPATGNLDAAALEDAVTERTRAVLPVHLYGHLCAMDDIERVARRHDLAVVEDCAHALEGVRGGERPGARSAAACFSFYATKNVTGGEGGIIATNDAEIAERLRRLRVHGVDKDAFTRHGALYVHYDMVELGLKANLTDIQAALVRPQLARVADGLARRERLARRYEQAFAALPGVRTLSVLPGTTSARHLFTILVDPERRDELLWALQRRRIGVAVNYRPIHLMSYYRERFGYREGRFPEAERIGAATVTLPLYPDLALEEQDRVIAAVTEILA